eukprot:TRINITY_DN32894_c0_g1_i1.p1 TRINITY_DN32894_c0_g1~~TRINITY_DN32894_c0_g1_i1.p1  ORF type:complete len:1612 (+),score=297.74 TRINITY_DN32894_c0_g1_i1:164-4837(+)
MACKISTEIQAVIAMMRQNAKWAVVPHYIDDPDADDPLLHDFKILRNQIFGWEDWTTVAPLTYLAPFLAVIRSEKANTPITGAALSAVHKILELEFFSAETVGAVAAMHAIVDSVTSCRFEVTDAASEEIVLMKILQVLLECLKCSAGSLLTDRDVCTVVNTCFRVVHQSGEKGELLQRMACNTMQGMIRSIFARLPLLEEIAEEDAQQVQETEGTIGVPEEGREGRFGGEALTPRSLAAAAVHEVKREASANGQAEGKETAIATEPSGAGRPEGEENGAAVQGSLAAEEGGEGPIREDAPGNGVQSPHGHLHPSGEGEEVGEAALRDSPLERVSEEEGDRREALPLGRPHGAACMGEIFLFLCSLLTLEDPSSNLGEGGEEDMPLFALDLINSALELAGPSLARHPKLLLLVQEDLFRSLMQLGLSGNVLVLSLVCSVALNLYTNLRVHLKLQVEAFFAYVITRQVQGKYGAPYLQQEVVMEALVDFCRQPHALVEMYVNYDCDVTCNNTFEEIVNVLSKSAFPVNSPLSTLHVRALEGLIAIIQSIAERVEASSAGPTTPFPSIETDKFAPFWASKNEIAEHPDQWQGFIRKRKSIKKLLMNGVELFNREPKKGLAYLQKVGLLPEILDPYSVACFFRYAPGLSKNLMGEYLGEGVDFNVEVLTAFTNLFDFTNMPLDVALRAYLESFRLQGEAQKIGRVMEAFAGRYYEHCPQTLANKDTAYILAYSVIMLNTDQHNGQVRRKMTEEEFIRNNRKINDGADLPREMISELYHSIVKNEIRLSAEATSGTGAAEMTYSRWIDLIRRSSSAFPYLPYAPDPVLDSDMFSIIAGPAIAALSVVFDHTENEEVLQQCANGFLSVAKIAAHRRLDKSLDDLVVSLCKFTTLLNPTANAEEPAIAFGEDVKARIAAVTVFSIVHKSGDHIREGWRNILDCVLRLHKLGLLPAKVSSGDVGEEGAGANGTTAAAPAGDAGAHPIPAVAAPPIGRRRRFGLMSRFSQFLSLDSDEDRSEPTEQQLAAHQRTLKTIEACGIENIFIDSKFLQSDSLLELARALVWAAGRPQRGVGSFSIEDEDTAVFCLELLITVTLNNRDRIARDDCPLWPMVAEHIASIVQGAAAPGLLVEKAVLGLLRICQRLLPYKEELAEELLRSLQLIQKLDAKVADVLCERITREVLQLVRANAAHIRSPSGWQTVCFHLKITARHPEAAEAGFEGLTLIMANGSHVTPANYVPCLDAAREFAETRVGGIERSIWALDLLAGQDDRGQPAGLLACLQNWAEAMEEAKKVPLPESWGRKLGESSVAGKGAQELTDMWLRLAQAIRRVCGDQREEVRSHAIECLQRCLLAAESIKLPPAVWGPCFDQVVFMMLDDLLDIGVREKPREFRGIEGTLYRAMKLLSKVFLHFLPQLASLPHPGFRALWLAVLSRMEMYMKARLKGGGSDKLQENIPELLKNMILVMHAKGVLQEESTVTGDSLWELTWHHVQGIAPGMKTELFPPAAPAPLPPPPHLAEIAIQPARPETQIPSARGVASIPGPGEHLLAERQAAQLVPAEG